MKLFAILCIVAGALTIFLSDGTTSYDGYLKIVGFILLMYGLYKCTRFWVEENPREEKDDDSGDQQDLASRN